MPNNIKLYIDDLRNPGDDWVWVKSNTEAIRFIATYGHEIEEISIDHDISHYATVGICSIQQACGETFEATARYILANTPSTLKIIRLHSGNPAGRDNLRAILSVLKKSGIEISG